MGSQPGISFHKILNRKHIYDMDNEIKNRLQNSTILNSNATICANNSNCIASKKNNNCIKMSTTNNTNKNYLISQNFTKQTHQHNYFYYNFKNKNHLTFLRILLTTLLIFMLRTTTINCLPVTSKPIENTPENLAWEAWIMLPPPATSERHRKIMPKSIFVLPTNINNNSKDNLLPIPQPQIQCPPGHRIDNSKCIPTISINRDQLLIDQLSNLLHVSTKPDDSNYDDYDYGDYSNAETINFDFEMAQTQLPPFIKNPNSFTNPEKNSEPLKINFSLEKFTIAKDDASKDSTLIDLKNESNEYVMELNGKDSIEEDFKLQPFRDQETSSTIIDLSTATFNATKSNTTSFQNDTNEGKIEKEIIRDIQSNTEHNSYTATSRTTTKSTTTEFSTIPEQIDSTTFPALFETYSATISESNDSDKSSVTTKLDEESQVTTKRESASTTTETEQPATITNENKTDRDDNSPATTIKSNTMELSNIEANHNIFASTNTTNDSTTVVSLLSSDDIESSSNIETESNFNSTAYSDYEYDHDVSSNKKYPINNQNLDIVTQEMEKQDLNERLSEESLVLHDKSIEENSTDSLSEISLSDDITTNLPMYDDNTNEQFEQFSSTNSKDIEKSTTESTIQIPNSSHKNTHNNEKLQHQIVHVDSNRHHNHSPAPSTVSISASQPIEWHQDTEPLMESIESSNRFVYHHLGSSSVPQSNTQILPSTVQNDNFNNEAAVVSTTPKTFETPSKRDSQAEINEQLRLINAIVEENKRRAAQSTKIRFPESGVQTSSSTSWSSPPSVSSSSSSSSTTPLHSSTFVRFPAESQHEQEQQQHQSSSTPYHVSTASYIHSSRFDPEKLIFHRRFFHQTTTPAPTTSNSGTTADLNKPFWWLPSGWEIDQSGDRPMLIRFWSRSPSRNSEQFSSNTESYTDQYRTAASNTHHIVTENSKTHVNGLNNEQKTFNTYSSDEPNLQHQQHTITTSRYRENSRSPTDSLFHEVPSSQNVYKVLNAGRQWK